mmetsp:Transcript_29795/g.48014  ORF Transcript_29795/g.48014 Transcript_29795/m.48014 type:complete len:201 (+) Transcript_29795:558-1160(+)
MRRHRHISTVLGVGLFILILDHHKTHLLIHLSLHFGVNRLLHERAHLTQLVPLGVSKTALILLLQQLQTQPSLALGFHRQKIGMHRIVHAAFLQRPPTVTAAEAARQQQQRPRNSRYWVYDIQDPPLGRLITRNVARRRRRRYQGRCARRLKDGLREDDQCVRRKRQGESALFDDRALLILVCEWRQDGLGSYFGPHAID